MRFWIFVFAVALGAVGFAACDPQQASRSFADSASAKDASPDASGLSVDAVDLVSGIEDGIRDPAVVAIDGAGIECSGVLVAGDALLTSSICVGPPGFPADQLAIRPADPSSPAMAHGVRTILSPTVETLGAAVAIVLLDRPVLDALPTWIRTAPAIPGEHLRTVGFEPVDGDPTKLLRDHLPVISGRLQEFLVSENPCGKQEGSAAFDEDTEELIGIVLNAARCDDPYGGTTYARLLPLRNFIEDALGTPTDLDAGWGDAGKRLRGSKGKTATDFRSFCDGGATCSTGVCIDQNGEQTCSRTCGSGDRCPTATHCLKAAAGDAGALSVCADP
ncbi:MAG: hypothetical protein ABI461_20520 [Polyangiaceae bacterium]